MAKKKNETNTPNASGGKSPVRWVVLFLFACSGIAGLIHEVSWTRMLRLVMGNTTYSLATVLGVFMAGLAGGSYFGGRLIDRRKDSLRIFGILECAVGLSCLALPYLISSVEPVYRNAYQAGLGPTGMTMLRLGLCGLLLLVPATLMGATLPVLCRWFVSSLDRTGRGVSLLYALNTLGAALGASLTAFYLIPSIGLGKTIWTGAALNIVVGVIGLILHARVGKTEPVPSDLSVDASEEKDPIYGRGAIGVLLAGYGLAGVAAMIFQISWTRTLTLLIGSSVYAFGLIVTAFILGIGIGAFVFAPWADKSRDPLRRLAFIQFTIGISSLVVAPFFGLMPSWVAQMIAKRNDSFAQVQFAEFMLSFGVMLVPTLMMGAAFPLVARVFARQSDAVGKSVGSAYCSNTIGGVVGSILCGFVLIPTLGIQWSIFAAAIISVLVGVSFLMASITWSRTKNFLTGGTFLVAALTVIFLIPPWDPARMTSAPFVAGTIYSEDQLRSSIESIERPEDFEVLFHNEGVSATVSVRKNRKSGLIQLLTSGRVEASSKGGGQQQRFLAHLPLLLHPEPQDVAVIGMASGITLDAAARHPIKTLDIVELSPGVIDATRFFNDFNNNVLDDPRLNTILADGRNHLSLTDRRYDVIISQPSDPATAGVATLFTHEFFQSCYDRLNDPGFVCVWLKADTVDKDVFRSVVSSFSDVFDGVGIWSAADLSEYMLVGSRGSMACDMQILEERIQSPELASDFEAHGVHNVETLSRLFIAGNEATINFSADAPPHIDDLPALEFSAPRAVYSQRLATGIIDALTEVRDGQLDWIKSGTVDEAKMAKIWSTNEKHFKCQTALCRYDLMALENRNEEAFELLVEAAQLCPRHLKVIKIVNDIRKLMEQCASTGQFENAIKVSRKLVRLQPKNPIDINNLAWLLATYPKASELNRLEAIELAKKAADLVAIDNKELLVRTLVTQATAYHVLGDFGEAHNVCSRAIEMMNGMEQTPQVVITLKDLQQRVQVYNSKLK